MLFGNTCNLICPFNCGDQGECDFTTGFCATCRQGMFGSVCQFTCPGVDTITCNQANGVATLCENGFFGSSCQFTCDPTCLGGVCALDGSCTHVRRIR